MNFEIEFLPVGEKTKAGDAIVIKYETGPGYFQLLLIDGGSAESGKKVIEHVKKHYGQNAFFNHAILTHCDVDHACGFREIVEGIRVDKVWMHLPWMAAGGALPYFADKKMTAQALESKIRAEYDLIDDIYRIATEKKIVVEHPFAGAKIGPFTVLSPEKELYEVLLPQFDRTPEADQKALEAFGIWIGKSPSLIARMMDKAVAKSEKWINETWENERLKEGGKTSATNESSVVMCADFGNGERVLLTGDAGHWALMLSAAKAKDQGFPLQKFSFVQIPHHGSRSNVGPAILNLIIGPILPKGSPQKFSAYVSAPMDDEHHPRKMVLNAFVRRGGGVIATQGTAKCYTVGYSFKEGYSGVKPMPFASQVEDYD